MIKLNKPFLGVLALLALILVAVLHLNYTSTPSYHPLHQPTAPCITPTNIQVLIDHFNTSNTQLTRPGCFTHLAQTMEQVYNIEISGVDVKVPETMRGLVQDSWFKGDPQLYAEFKHPVVFTVTDRYTHQTSTVNPLRALRPKPAGDPGEALRKVKQVIADSKEGCNFCNDEQTLEDTFGRIVWEKSKIFTAENAFRFYDYTGMVIPGGYHDYMDIDYQTFEAMLTYEAVTWYSNIHDRHPAKTHPVFLWDVLGKAGASQVHPHIQLIMGSGFYPGKWGAVQDAAVKYEGATGGGDYLQDLVDIHVSLGLGIRYKTAAIIVPINPTKDREIWVIGNGRLFDWSRLYYIAFRTYIEELQVYCFSQSGALPSNIMKLSTNSKFTQRLGNVMMVILGSRGECDSPYNDVSSLELYSINSISTDYYETFAAVKKTFDKYIKKISADF